MESFLIKAAQLVLALSMLIIIHEGGHYLFARLFGIKVEKFYLFFNPWFSLAKWKPKKKKAKYDSKGREKGTWRDTEYGIGWLPLGGYVKIAGMIDESMDREQMKLEPQPWEFRVKPAWQRLLVMLGGVMMNFILAFIIYIGIMWHWGTREVPMENVYLGFDFTEEMHRAGFRDGDQPLLYDGKRIDSSDPTFTMKMLQAREITVLRDRRDTVVIPLPSQLLLDLGDNRDSVFMEMRVPVVVLDPVNGEPADKAGLQRFDRILAINGAPTEDYVSFTDALKENAGREIDLAYLRGTDTLTTRITPTSDGKIGIRLQDPSEVYGFEYLHYTLWQAIPKGIKYGVDTLVGYVKSLGLVFTKRGAQQIGGFGAIGSMFPDKWNWYTFWNMAAFLSVILGFMNLLPIPALDGGHAAFAIYEIVSRRKPSDKFIERAQMAGMIFLIALLLYANLNDIIRLFR